MFLSYKYKGDFKNYGIDKYGNDESSYIFKKHFK